VLGWFSVCCGRGGRALHSAAVAAPALRRRRPFLFSRAGAAKRESVPSVHAPLRAQVFGALPGSGRSPNHRLTRRGELQLLLPG
jgi:hypothetical protein